MKPHSALHNSHTTIRDLALLGLVLLGTVAFAPMAEAVLRVSNAVTGNWGSTTSWAGGVVPATTDTFQIVSGANITTASTATVAGGTVDAGGTLTVSSKLTDNGATTVNGLMTCASSSLGGSAAITVGNGGTLKFTAAALSSFTGSITVANGGTYDHAFSAGTVPTCTWNSGSTCLIEAQTGTSGPSGMGQAFYNLTYNCPGITGNDQLGLGNSAGFSVAGTLTVQNTGSGTVRIGSTSGTTTLSIANISITGGSLVGTGTSGANFIINVGGNISVSGGTLDLRSASGSTTINISGNLSVTGSGTFTCASSSGTGGVNFAGTGTQTFSSGGTISPSGSGIITWTINSGATVDFGVSVLSSGNASVFVLASGGGVITANPSGITSSGATGSIQVGGTRTFNSGNYTFNGSSAQTAAALPATINNLTVNNAAGFTLPANTTVNGALALTAGKVTGNIILGSSGTESSTSGWVNGTIAVPFSSPSSAAHTFFVGDASSKSPCAVSSFGASGSGTLTASATSGAHPNLGSSDISGTKYINRYWTIGNSGLTPSSYTFVGTFVAGDVLGGANTANLVVRKYASGWTSPSSSSSTSTTATGTGFTSFSDFAAGEIASVGPLDHFNISSISSPQTAGTAISGITITAKDSANNTVSSFTGTVTFGGTAGVTGTSGSFTAGQLTGVSITPTVAGSSLTFTVDDGASHTGTTTITTINPGALDHFTISSISSPQTAGTAITGVTLTAKDVNNNTVSGFTSTVTYGGTAGITGTSAGFTAGQLTGVSVTPTAAGSGKTFTVTASGKTGSQTFDVDPGALDHFTISSIPSPQTAGTAITGLTLTALDANNNTLNTGANAFTGTVTYGGTAGVTGTSASFTAGQLTGVSVTPTVAGSGKTFTVTASGKTGSQTFDVNPGAIDHYAVTAPATASKSVNFNVTVTAKDAYNNTVTTASGTQVTMARASGSGTVAFGSNPVTLDGAGTFVVTAQDDTAETITISATDTGSKTGTSGSILVKDQKYLVTLPGETFTDGSGNSGTVTAQTAGGSFTIELRVVDGGNNVDAAVNASGVTINYTGPANSPNASAPVYTTTVDFVNGVATTTLNTTLKKAETTTITATDGTIAGVASSSLTVNPASVDAGTSTVSASPGSQTTDGGATSTITVTAKDAYGNPISGQSVTLSSTGTGNSLTQPGSATDSNGQTTGTIASTVAEAKTVSAVIGATSVTQTANVTFTPGALDHFTISSISSPQTAGTAITGVTLTAKDVNNNTLNTGPNVFASTVTYGGTAGITGTSSSFTAGQLTGVSVTPTVAGSGKTFTVTASGKTGSQTFDVDPGALDHFSISSISSPQTAGTAITGLTLTALDANNNTLNTGANAFTGTVTYGGTAGVTGTSAGFTAGQLTGVSVTPTVAGTGRTFTVTASGKTGSQTFDVNPGAIDHYAVAASSPQTATVPFLTTVTAQDANNNTVTTDSSTSVTMSSSGGAQFDSNSDSTFGDNTKTLTSGTFTISTKDDSVESITLTATDANSKTGTSASVVVNPMLKFQSKTSGNWNDFNTWQVDPGSGFVDAVSGQTPSSTDDTIVILNGHTVTVSASVSVDQVTVNSGGQITVSSGQTLTVAYGAGTDLDVSGTVASIGTLALAGSGTPTITFESTGVYDHQATGATANSIPAASWKNGSLCRVTGLTSATAAPTVTASQDGLGYYDFTYNCTGQGTITTFFDVPTVRNIIKVLSTGSTGVWRCYATTATSRNWGELQVTGGKMDLWASSSATAAQSLTVGNVTISTGATLQWSGSSAVVYTVNASGNWNNNGTVSTTTAGVTVNFNGTSQTLGGTAGSTFKGLTVANGCTLSANTAPTITTFTINGGGKYIQTTASVTPGTTRSFAATSTYEYQNSGVTSFATTYGNLTINWTGAANINASGAISSILGTLRVQNTGTGSFRLTGNTAVTLNIGGSLQVDSAGTFNLCNGTGNPVVNVAGNVVLAGALLSSNPSTLNVAGDWSNTGGVFTPANTTVTFNGTGAQAINSTATENFNNLTVNKSSGTLSLGVNSSVAGNLSVSAGTMDLGAFTANRSTAGGTLTVASGTTLKIGGTGTLPSNYSAHSIGSTSTIEYSGGSQSVATLNSSQNYGNLTLSGSGTKTLAGSFTLGGTLTVGSGATLDFNSKTITTASAPSLNGALIMPVTKTAPNTFTGSKLTQTAGTLTYGGALTVTTLGLPLANGESIDLFDGSLAGSFSPLNLPGGLGHWNTANLNGTGTITFNNINPVASDFTIGVAVGGSTTSSVIGKFAAATDADGDAVTISVVSTPASGTATIVGGTNITYTSTAAAASDSFTYTVSDGLGGTDTKTVTVTISSPEGFNKLSGPTGTGPYSFSYLGIPGRNYALDESPNLVAPYTWNPVVTNTADGIGSLEYNGVTLSYPSGSFRTRYVP